MPDIVVSFDSYPDSEAGIERGVKRLLARCPWLRHEQWTIDKLTVRAIGNKYEFPKYARDGNGCTMILSGDIRIDDIEDRIGGRDGFSHYTEDDLLNSLFNLLYRKGKESLCGLNGRYSLAIWDEKEQELNVATDPFGNRHIYYLNTNDHISLSTNLSVLTCSPHFSRTLDLQGVVESLCLGYQLEDRTLYTGINVVPVSSLLVCKGGTLQFIQNKRFAGAEPRPELAWKDAVDELHFLLLDSLKRRVRSDAEYIIPLSGGLDSRCVTGLSHELGLKCGFYTYGVKHCKDIQIAPRVASAAGSMTTILPNKLDYILRRWGDPFLMNGDIRIPTISVFIDFLESIGPERGIFISGFMGDTMTGDVFQVCNMDDLQTPEQFFSLRDLSSVMKMPGWEDLAQQIPITLSKMRDEFAGSDYSKDLMLNLATRQRRYFSFQERLIEYYGGLIVPFEDVKVVEFFFGLPFMATDNQELYKRFQVRFFPALASIPTVKQSALFPGTKDVVFSSLQRDFRYLNAKYFRGSLKIPSFFVKSRSVFAVNHASAIRHNGPELTDMIIKNREALDEILDFRKIEELIDNHMRGDNSGTRKILAILLILSGLQVCNNGA